MPIMVDKEKWILYKHTCKYEIIKAVALDVKNSCRTDISNTERYRMQDRLTALNLYKTRNPADKPLDSINHRINTLEFYMFGYEDTVCGEKRFIFSPLGNLFLKYITDDNKTKKIFTAMLFAMQFDHPCTNANKYFHLFPFRLIFMLLNDSRLEGKLYNFEYACIIAFVKQVTEQSYEDLVEKILSLRSKSSLDIAEIMKADEHTYVNSVHEWEYFMQTLLQQVGILDKHKGQKLCTLYHPSKPNTNSLPTKRIATDGYVTLNKNILPFVQQMLKKYSAFDEPLYLNEEGRLRIDVIKQVYSFYPKELLDEIGEDENYNVLLNLPHLIEEYSNNPDNGTAYLFENVLEEGFNMFYNVNAKKIGGAGHTDIECLYITKRKKFAVEAKSTEHKLIGINTSRLSEHRNEIGGEYTIVITSRYVPAAKRDIIGTNNVIILASTFAEYLYNYIYHDVREIDYEEFDSIIENHLGNDISREISDMTLNKFAAIG